MTLNQLILDVIVFKEIWIVNKELSDFFHKGIVIHSNYSSFKRLQSSPPSCTPYQIWYKKQTIWILKKGRDETRSGHWVILHDTHIGTNISSCFRAGTRGWVFIGRHKLYVSHLIQLLIRRNESYGKGGQTSGERGLGRNGIVWWNNTVAHSCTRIRFSKGNLLKNVEEYSLIIFLCPLFKWHDPLI